jgi:hypothetical protein
LSISFQLRELRESVYPTQRDDPEAKKQPLVHNCRDVQALGDRTIYSSNPDDATVFSHPLSSPMSITMAVFCGMLVLLMLTKNNNDVAVREHTA